MPKELRMPDAMDNYTVTRSDDSRLVLHAPHTFNRERENLLVQLEIANALWALHRTLANAEAGANLTALTRVLQSVADTLSRVESQS